jgi:hypothetical protein
MNIPELGSVVLGITDVRKESINNSDEDIPMEIIHTYDFNCSCNNGPIDRDSGERKPIVKMILLNTVFLVSSFDLLSTFPDNEKLPSVETIYESFTLALMSKRKFDLRASIIIYESDKMNNKYLLFNETFPRNY